MPFRSRGGGRGRFGRGRGRGGKHGKGKKGQEEVVHELKMPQGTEVVGTVTQAVGASNFRVMCSDNFDRMCSIPGRLRRRFWIKEGDIVVVKPWVVQGNVRGDIVWRYSIGDKERLRARGFNIP